MNQENRRQLVQLESALLFLEFTRKEQERRAEAMEAEVRERIRTLKRHD